MLDHSTADEWVLRRKLLLKDDENEDLEESCSEDYNEEKIIQTQAH